MKLSVVSDHSSAYKAVLECAGSGPCEECLETDPVALSELRANSTAGMDHICLQKYNDLALYRWHGRRSNGGFYPIGRIMELAQEVTP